MSTKTSKEKNKTTKVVKAYAVMMKNGKSIEGKFGFNLAIWNRKNDARTAYGDRKIVPETLHYKISLDKSKKK